MGYRLSKIYTCTGDAGETGLGDGSRVAKTSPRVESMGSLDELSSHIGVLLAERLPDDVAQLLIDIQHDLFDAGGELAVPGTTLIESAHVTRLEAAIDHYNAPLPPLEDFVLPGGSRVIALCHVARSVCRRAERDVARLRAEESIGASLYIYTNRLSDLLFVLARALARAEGVSEVIWDRERPRLGVRVAGGS